MHTHKHSTHNFINYHHLGIRFLLTEKWMLSCNMNVHPSSPSFQKYFIKEMWIFSQFSSFSGWPHMAVWLRTPDKTIKQKAAKTKNIKEILMTWIKSNLSGSVLLSCPKRFLIGSAVYWLPKHQPLSAPNGKLWHHNGNREATVSELHYHVNCSVKIVKILSCLWPS